MSSAGSLTLCIQNLRSPDSPRARRGRPDHLGPFLEPAANARPQAPRQPHTLPRRRGRRPPEHVCRILCRSARRELHAFEPRGVMEVVGAHHDVQSRQHRPPAYGGSPRRPPRASRPEKAAPTGDSFFPRWMLEHVDRASPSPEEKLIVLEELERLLDGAPRRPPCHRPLEARRIHQRRDRLRDGAHRPVRRVENAAHPQALCAWRGEGQYQRGLRPGAKRRFEHACIVR